MNKMDWLTEDLNLSHNPFYAQRRKALQHHHQGSHPKGNIDSVVNSGCNRGRVRWLFQFSQILTTRLPAERLYLPLYLPLDTSHQALNREISA